ncbi:MAG: plasmid mobilization relaxosome protein MobC [Eubacteriales bacterium]
MAKRERNTPVFFRVTEEERNIIEKKMHLIGVNDLGTYLRRMAIYGYMIEINTEPLNRLSMELSRIGHNVNQLAKRANETGSIYENDIEKIAEDVKDIKGYLKAFMCDLVEH